MLSIFSCTFGPFVCLLQRNVFSSPLSIFKSDCLGFFSCWVVEVMYIHFDICFLSDVCFRNTFSHSLGCLCALLLLVYINYRFMHGTKKARITISLGTVWESKTFASDIPKGALWVNTQNKPCCRNTTKATRHKIGSPCLLVHSLCVEARGSWDARIRLEKRLQFSHACCHKRNRPLVWRVMCQWVITKKSNSLKGWSTRQGQDASHGHVDALACVRAF